jgi:hypothetical protein
MTPTALDGRKDMTHVEYGSAASSRSCRIPVLFTVALLLALAFAGNALGAVTPVPLATADSYAVLAGTTVTNTGPTTVSGDLGLSPGSSVTGFPPGLVSPGTQNVANPAAVQAQSDLVLAYNDAAGRTPATTVAGDTLGGLTLTSGVYSGGALDLTGTLTLDGQGDSGAVFIFQAASTLITASASSVKLINGASPCNVFWQVGSSATLGTTTSFKGTILALTSIGLNTGAKVDGRVLARNGAVTLDSNLISNTCKNGTYTQPPPDTTPPICLLTATFNGSPKSIQVTVQDLDSGLGTIVVTTSTNASTVFPPFTLGTTGPVVVTATKTNQSLSSHIALTVTDAAGNVRTCDPLWPGKKAAKPMSRAKHQRVGRHAAGWGRRTT